MAHLKSSSLHQAPDLCLDIQPSRIISWLSSKSPINHRIIGALKGVSWVDPIPAEIKSRRMSNTGSNSPSQIKQGLSQLISYWKRVPSVAGYGLIMQINVYPKTEINMHLLIPRISEANNVKSIVTGSGTYFPDEIIIKEFERILGGRYV